MIEHNSCRRQETIAEELKRLSAVDIRSVDPATLVDIEDVHINPDLSDRERMLDYIRQIHNPYCYRCHGVTVKISFSGKDRLEDCLARCFALD